MIQIEDARGLAARAVLTQPRGFAYASGPNKECRYFPLKPGMVFLNEPDPIAEDDPRCTTGCIIGVALSLAGETRHLSKRHQFDGAMEICSAYPGLMSIRAARYFTCIQGVQDGGATWEYAYTVAEGELLNGSYNDYADDRSTMY